MKFQNFLLYLYFSIHVLRFFCLIRRFIIRYSPLIADTEHLHTILVNFFIKQKKEKKIAHLLSSVSAINGEYLIINLLIIEKRTSKHG